MDLAVIANFFLTWCFVNRISILKIPYGLLVRHKGWSRGRGAKQSEEWRPARCPEGRALRVDQVRFFKFQIWFRQLRHTYNSVFYAAKLKLISACIFDFTLNNLLVKGQFILQAGVDELLPRASSSLWSTKYYIPTYIYTYIYNIYIHSPVFLPRHEFNIFY